MDIKQVVAIVATMGLFMFFSVLAIYRLLSEIDSLRKQLKDAGRRYEQLYSAYVEACNANPNQPRVSTITQEPITMSQTQWNAMNPAKSATEYDLRKQALHSGQKTSASASTEE